MKVQAVQCIVSLLNLTQGEPVTLSWMNLSTWSGYFYNLRDVEWDMIWEFYEWSMNRHRLRAWSTVSCWLFPQKPQWNVWLWQNGSLTSLFHCSPRLKIVNPCKFCSQGRKGRTSIVSWSAIFIDLPELTKSQHGHPGNFSYQPDSLRVKSLASSQSLKLF